MRAWHLQKSVIFLILALLLSNSAIATEDTPAETENVDIRSPDVVEAFVQKRAKIQTEIERLGEHSWAGEYYQGDGLGVNLYLALAPESGCTYLWTGCRGVYDRNYGSVFVNDDGSIKVTWELKNPPKIFFKSSPSLIPVRWGDRRYLIPLNEVEHFCRKIYSKFGEPRDWVHGDYFLAGRDYYHPVTGLPELPEAFRNHLLIKPVYAEITEILECKTVSLRNEAEEVLLKQTNGIRFRKTLVKLNAGSEDGIKSGHFFRKLDDGSSPIEIHVVSVSDHVCEGFLQQAYVGPLKYQTPFEEKLGLDDRAPQIGWKFVAGPNDVAHGAPPQSKNSDLQQEANLKHE